LILISTVGLGCTVIVTEEVPVHPFASVTVTIYAVVKAGVTSSEELVPPELQAYPYGPTPPLPAATSVADPPSQIAVASGVIPAEGGPTTVIIASAVPVHPETSVTVTVYVCTPIPGYVPSVVRISGDCNDEVNPFGPDHAYESIAASPGVAEAVN
jgi:hypothetical protein